MSTKQITDFTVKHIISEPGDCTRYDYLILEDYDDYVIMPCGSTFIFPQRLNYYDIIDINTVEECQDLIENCHYGVLQFVNPHTLLECINTIKELHKSIK